MINVSLTVTVFELFVAVAASVMPTVITIATTKRIIFFIILIFLSY